MAKQKTKKAVSKRFRVTKTGKVMRRVSFGRHLRRHKSARQLRRYKRSTTVSKARARKVKRLLARA